MVLGFLMIEELVNKVLTDLGLVIAKVIEL